MEKLKDKLLSRVDFSILITITIALGSLWRITSYSDLAESIIINILVGAYFLMGLFLCFVKCKEIFAEKNVYGKLSEVTAFTFFNSWFYVLIFYFLNFITQSYLPKYYWYALCFSLAILFLWTRHKRPRTLKSLFKFANGFLFWHLVSTLITGLLLLNITIEFDKQYYDFNDNIYVTLENHPGFNDEIKAIFIDINGMEITDVTELKGNTYVIPASELYNKDIYVVYTHPFKLNKEKLLENPDFKKISFKARIKKLPLKIRMPEEI